MPAYTDLEGQVAVVTGGSRGIGAATCRALAANGVSVAVVGRDEAAIAATVDDIIAAQGQAIGVPADCTCQADLGRLHEVVGERFGAVNILAVFAGGNAMPVPTTDEKAAHWREVMESDLTSVFLTISEFLPGMTTRGSGTIITMASAAARQPADSSAAYAAAKAGVIGFTRHLAREAGPLGVRVNCISPSAIVNDKMKAWLSDKQRQQVGRAFPLQRLGEPEDVAAAALFLASSASSWITGVVVDVAGGMIMV